MKRLLFIFAITAFALQMQAQPKARRAEQKSATAKAGANTMSMRAQISYPVALKMDEDVVWRRDVYRVINLTESANAGLYYPEEPIDGKQNLFTTLFKLMLRGQIKAYEYRLDGNEVFTDSARIKPVEFMDNYHIYYERNGKQIHIDNSDIPSRDVRAYYLKESAYYDEASGTFHKKVIALCPVMKRSDDFGDMEASMPLFWVKYDDVAPYLAKQIIMTSDLNNAATMSADDFFTKTQYRGKIYKTTNMLGRTLAQIVGDDAEKLSAEQKRIEAEIEQFEKNIYGSGAKNDSVDAEKPATTKPAKAKSSARKAKVSGASSAKTKKQSTKTKTKSSSSSRVSARRERH